MSNQAFPSATRTWHSSPYPAISPTRPELSAKGKSVIITGGATGIGLSISLSFALAGASKIAIIGRREKVLQEAATSIRVLVGDRTAVFTFSADIAEKEAVEASFSKITKAFGDEPLQILVNNAGYYSGVRPYGTETSEEWQNATDVNIKGVYNVTSAFIARANPDATLINISSAIAHIDPFFGFSAYAATKMAGARLMECILHEKPDLHVVNVHPGQVVETDMARKLSADMKHIDDGEIVPTQLTPTILNLPQSIWLEISLFGLRVLRLSFSMGSSCGSIGTW